MAKQSLFLFTRKCFFLFFFMFLGHSANAVKVQQPSGTPFFIYSDGQKDLKLQGSHSQHIFGRFQAHTISGVSGVSRLNHLVVPKHKKTNFSEK